MAPKAGSTNVVKDLVVKPASPENQTLSMITSSLNGSQEHKEYKRMLSKLAYMKSRGQEGALAAYHRLPSMEAKVEFFKQYKVKGNFSFCFTDDERMATKHEETTTGRWQTRFQVAEAEKLKLDDDLLKALLEGLDSKPHDNEVWRKRGEKLYFYVNKSDTQTESHEKTSTCSASMNVNKAALDALNTPKGTDAVEDAPQGNDVTQKLKQAVSKIVSASMAADVLLAKGKVNNEDGTYDRLVQTFEPQVVAFKEMRDKTNAYLQTLLVGDKPVIAVANKILQEAETHLEVFKGLKTLKDMEKLFKSK